MPPATVICEHWAAHDGRGIFRSGTVGAVKGATKEVNTLKSLATAEGKAVHRVVPVVHVQLKVAPLEALASAKSKVPSKLKAKAKVSRKKAAKPKAPKTSNVVSPSCATKNNMKARDKQHKNAPKETSKSTTASPNQEKISAVREKIGTDIKNHPLRQSYENEVAGLEKNHKI